MKWNEYRDLALRTSNPSLCGDKGIKYSSLKIFGEVGELLDLAGKELGQGHPHSPSKWREESGDLLWHIVDGLRHVGGRAEYLDPDGNPGNPHLNSIQPTYRRTLDETLCGMGSLASDLLIVSFKEDHSLGRSQAVDYRLRGLVDMLVSLSHNLNIPLADIAYDNVSKLSHRYPEGFDPKRSIKRRTT